MNNIVTPIVTQMLNIVITLIIISHLLVILIHKMYVYIVKNKAIKINCPILHHRRPYFLNVPKNIKSSVAETLENPIININVNNKNSSSFLLTQVRIFLFQDF